jgi:hypothetical protein
MGLFGQFPGILSMAYLLQFWYFLTSSVVVVEVPHISLAHTNGLCYHVAFTFSCHVIGACYILTGLHLTLN